MTLKEVQDLFSYDEWATDRMLETVSALTQEQFDRDMKTSHTGVHGTLIHMCGADWVWLERWKGTSPGALLTPDELPTLDSIKQRWKAYRKEITDLLRSFDDTRVEMPVAYKDMRGNPNSQPFSQQMLHKINHASYHRGQVVAMVRQLGIKPQNTDLIGYYRSRLH
jgi:uncharacterized damage-inducible protein DinB